MICAKRYSFVTILALCLVATTPLLPAENAFCFDESRNALVHSRSGIAFPSTLGPFVGISAQAIDSNSDNVAIGYRCASPRAELTVYVRYANITITQYYDQSKRAIISLNPKLELIAEDQASHSATYRGTSDFDKREQPVISVLCVFQEGDWLTKTRLTLPFPQEGLSDEDALMSFLDLVPKRSMQDNTR